jgi:hypothetical protein
MIPVGISHRDLADASEYYQRIGPQTPPTKGRVSGLMHRVRNYANEVLVALHLRAGTPAADDAAKAFRATSFRRILCVITTALRRVSILEHRLSMEAGIGLQAALARFRALHRKPQRAAAPNAPPAGDGPAGDGSARCPDPQPEPARRGKSRKVAPSERRREQWRQDDGPSAAQIAADITRRGVGAVIADICRDLGITSKHPLWPELAAAIRAFGGSTEALEEDEATGTRWCSSAWLDLPYAKPPPTYDFHAFYSETGGKVLEWMQAYEARERAATATGPP